MNATVETIAANELRVTLAEPVYVGNPFDVIREHVAQAAPGRTIRRMTTLNADRGLVYTATLDPEPPALRYGIPLGMR